MNYLNKRFRKLLKWISRGSRLTSLEQKLFNSISMEEAFICINPEAGEVRIKRLSGYANKCQKIRDKWKL